MKTSLMIFKHYKLKPSFSIIKDDKTKDRVGVGVSPHLILADQLVLIWSNLNQFYLNDQTDLFWSFLIQFDPTWSDLTQFYLIWTKL